MYDMMDMAFDLIHLPVIAVLVVIAASLSATYAYGRFAKRARGVSCYALPLKPDETELDRACQRLAREQDGLGVKRNGLSLIDNNLDAFAVRVLSARMAQRSLDLMYYIWDDDLTGRLLLNEILEAADRGVRVRLLLDDINAQGRDPAYAALDQHPNINIRMFNPSRARSNGLRRGFEVVLRVLTVTRRMHNKAFIIDGRMAIVGGRNIADAYFGAGKNKNFRDLDLLLVGPAVQQAEGIFDNFWNSEMALPIHVLTLPRSLKNPLHWREKLRAFHQSAEARPFLDYLRAGSGLETFLDVRHRLFVADKVEVLSDPPQKAMKRQPENWLMRLLMAQMLQTTENLQLTSPYFVPGKSGTRELSNIAARGCQVQILTNSLAATDVAAVHGGYISYRKKLVKAKIELYELKPEGGRQRLRLFGSGRASLHTKAFLIDRKIGFVGSFNFDPRSVSLNTEMGILFECDPISQAMDALFAQEITPQMSYHIGLNEKNYLRWNTADEGGQPICLKHEPESRPLRRAFVRLISLLPIESQL